MFSGKPFFEHGYGNGFFGSFLALGTSLGESLGTSLGESFRVALGMTGSPAFDVGIEPNGALDTDCIPVSFVSFQFALGECALPNKFKGVAQLGLIE